MLKSRDVKGTYSSYDGTDNTSRSSQVTLLDFIDGPRRGPGNCTHVQPGTLTGVFQRHSSIPYFVSYNDYPFTTASLRIPIKKDKDLLNWSKLPSSSSFGIIQIIAELDETVSMFAKNMYRQLSYGKFTWGVMPLVSDLKAILKAVENTASNLSNIPYEDSYVTSDKVRFSTSFNDVNGQTPYYFEASYRKTYRFSGSLDISFQDQASVLLDRLGFHPDLATAWDLIPFSFVVDYLLPIGDFLESFRGGGWVKCAIFKGWRTVKTEVYSVTQHTSNYSKSSPNLVGKTFKSFSRYLGTEILETPQGDFSPEFEAPSLREMINMCYLSGLFEARVRI